MPWNCLNCETSNSDDIHICAVCEEKRVSKVKYGPKVKPSTPDEVVKDELLPSEPTPVTIVPVADTVSPINPKPKSIKDIAIAVMMAIFVLFGIYHYDTVQTFNKKYKELSSDYKIQGDKYDDMKNKSFYVGKLDFLCKGDYNNNYKVYFDVLQKLKLKSFQIAGNKQGNIVIEIYNLKDEVISAVPVKVNKEKNIQTVNLDTYLQTGSYYITFKGDCDLWRNDSCSNYPYEIRKVINIKGNSSSSNFYYYFYNWELSF